MFDQNKQPILQVEGVTKSFGGLTALNNLSLDVYPGEIVGLIGPNGSGKTTIFNIIAGVLRPTKGKVLFEGKDLSKCSTHKISNLGIGTVHQFFRLFNNMGGFDNAIIGSWKSGQAGFLECMLGLPSARDKEQNIAQRMLVPLALLGILDARLKTPPSMMTLKDQRFLSIGRSLGGDPKLLLLDEPASALNYEEVKELTTHLARYRKDGISILMIDHRMELIMDICDRIIVLNYGVKIADDIPANIKRDEQVLAAYLGGEE